jgi:hypothetical protein
MNTTPARSNVVVLKQILNLIPLGMINRLARKTGVDAKARSFTVMSHVAALRQCSAFGVSSPVMHANPMKPFPRHLAVVLIAAAATWGTAARGDEPPAPRLVTHQTLAEPKALAALETPGRIVFQDDFETEASLDKFFEVRGRKEGRARIDTSPGNARSGKGSIRFTAVANDGKESGAGATGWLGDVGFDRAHLRYYIRFAPDYDQGNLNHTGGSMAAVSGSNRWQAMGSAGIRPRGDDHFNCRFEAWCDWRRVKPPGYLVLYTYWMDMRKDPDGHYWGNMLGPAEADRVVPERGRWHCLEHMIRANTPGKADGELAAWIDGRLYLHFTGIRWRSDARVRIKRFDLGAYIHQAAKDNTVWFDDVAVSTGYIGPQAGTAKLPR